MKTNWYISFWRRAAAFYAPTYCPLLTMWKSGLLFQWLKFRKMRSGSWESLTICFLVKGLDLRRKARLWSASSPCSCSACNTWHHEHWTVLLVVNVFLKCVSHCLFPGAMVDTFSLGCLGGVAIYSFHDQGFNKPTVFGHSPNRSWRDAK